MASEITILLIKHGLISGAIDWDDDEERNLAFDKFPPNSINRDGLIRLLKGGDPSRQETDEYIRYDRLGIIGAVMGSIVKGADREEIKKRDYSGMGFLHHTLTDAFGIGAFSGVSHMLDQSFLQGIDGILKILTSIDPDDFERSSERYTNSVMRAASASVLPNTLAQLNRMDREYMPDMRITKDMPMSKRLLKNFEYVIKERTFNTDGIPVKINWRGEPIKQTPRGANKVYYNLFDITEARQGTADPVSNELYRLKEVFGEAPEVIGTPNYAKKKKINVPNIKDKALRALRRMPKAQRNKYTFLNDEEFVESSVYLNTIQLNRVMEVSGKARYKELEDLTSSSKYEKLTDYEKLEAVNKINENYDSAIEIDRLKLRPHSITLLDIFQEIYENETQ